MHAHAFTCSAGTYTAEFLMKTQTVRNVEMEKWGKTEQNGGKGENMGKTGESGGK